LKETSFQSGLAILSLGTQGLICFSFFSIFLAFFWLLSFYLPVVAVSSIKGPIFVQVGPVPSAAPQAVSQGLSAVSRPATHLHTHEPPGPSPTTTSQTPNNRIDLSEEAALKMAIDASLRSASAEGILLTYPDDEAGPSRVSETIQPQVAVPAEAPASSTASPSAPPLPIHYPAIDTSPVNVDTPGYPPVSPPQEAPAPKVEEKGSQCVVCWDAPAEGVCIPCGHLAGCMDCLSQIKAKDWGCPVCRASIDQVIRVYSV